MIVSFMTPANRWQPLIKSERPCWRTHNTWKQSLRWYVLPRYDSSPISSQARATSTVHVVAVAVVVVVVLGLVVVVVVVVPVVVVVADVGAVSGVA